jgi:hypothetical protein
VQHGCSCFIYTPTAVDDMTADKAKQTKISFFNQNRLRKFVSGVDSKHSIIVQRSAETTAHK